jgi:uncharacterized protein YggT (Ycf19 family)
MFGVISLIVNVIFYVIEALLLLRFLLVLFAANISGTFAMWVFTSSASLVAPFRNIFPIVNIGTFAVDFTVLFALLVYAVIGQLILRVIYYFEYPNLV